MTDFTWPDDLPPAAREFWLEPHTGGSESPFNRVGKYYGLSAPRWKCSMTFRGGYDGTEAQAAFGPRVDGVLDKLRGPLNRIAIYDFARGPRGALADATGNYAATLGAMQMTITGMTPGEIVHAGDYVGGDGRPHRITDTVTVDGSGNALVSFEPPLAADIAVNGAFFRKVTGLFRLVDDSSGQNPVAAGEAQQMTLNFVEDSIGAIAVPSDGLVGMWVMDDRATSPSPLIPNRVSTLPVSKNLFRPSRRMFEENSLWAKTNTTPTDDYAAGPDGLIDASRIVGTGNWKMVAFYPNPIFPAGTYTIACSVKRNASSDQPFGFTKDGGSTRSAKTATSSWKRFSYSFTLGSTTEPNKLGICSSDGSTGADILIRDLELYKGSRDYGPARPDGHIYIDNVNAFAGTYSAGVQSPAIGIVQFPTALDLSTFTAQYCVSVITGGAYNAVLADAQDFTNFAVVSEGSNGPMDIVSANSSSIGNKNSTGQVFQTRPGLWNLQGTGYHVLTYRYDGTALELWLDDVRMFHHERTLTRSVRDFLFGSILYGAGASQNNYSGFTALWDRALTDAELRQSVAAQASQNSTVGVAVTGDTDDRIYVAEGDSISGGNGPECYPFLYGAHDSPAVIGTVWAVGGSSLANLVTRAPLVDAVIPPNKNGRTFLLSVLIGANDLAAYPGASDAAAASAYASALAAYCDARRAAGFKVVVCTILPRTNATHNTRRALVNAQIVTWAGTHADAICDFAADATMGPDAAASNTTYYSDGLHPTVTGYGLLEAIIRPALNGL